MAEDDTTPGGGEGTQDGKGLRAELTRTQGERDRYRAEVAELRAARLLGTGEYDLVSADDLKGVDPDKVEERAKALQGERAGVFKQGVEARFRQQGLTGEALTAAVDDFLTKPTGGATQDEQNAFERARSVGGGTAHQPVPAVNPETLSTKAKLEYALEHQTRSQSRR